MPLKSLVDTEGTLPSFQRSWLDLDTNLRIHLGKVEEKLSTALGPDFEVSEVDYRPYVTRSPQARGGVATYNRALVLFLVTQVSTGRQDTYTYRAWNYERNSWGGGDRTKRSMRNFVKHMKAEESI